MAPLNCNEPAPAAASFLWKPVCEIARQRAVPIFAALDFQTRGMQSMSWKQQRIFQFAGPTGFDEAQVMLFVRPVNLVTHNRVPQRSEMHADLMRAAGARQRPDETEAFARRRFFLETLLHQKLR